MKSGKKRSGEIKTTRKKNRVRRIRQQLDEIAETRARYLSDHIAAGTVPVDPAMLGHHVGYGDPDFLTRGSYLDRPFICADCGDAQIWTASQQKWWYEVAKGDLFSTAKRCRSCRRAEQSRKREARRVHLGGLSAKKAGKPPA